MPAPDFAEPVLGPAEGRIRGLNPGYLRKRALDNKQRDCKTALAAEKRRKR